MTGPQPPSGATAAKDRLFAPVSLAIVCLLFLLAVALSEWHTYPFGDEIAFVPQLARSDFSEWFLRGFTDYFRTYGEWSPSESHYIRPIVHAALWAIYALCSGLPYRAFVLICVLAFCAVLYLGASLVRRSALDLGASGGAASAIGWLFLLNPSVINNGLTAIPFQFDVLAGVFAVAAFRSAWKGSTFAPLCFLLLAVFTKETALPAPLAAALSSWLVARRVGRSVLLLLPLAIWAAVYSYALGPAVLGEEATPYSGSQGLAFELLRGAMIWPSGALDVDTLHEIVIHLGFGPGDAGGLATSRAVLSFLAIGLNLVLWLVIAAVLAKLLRPTLLLLKTGASPDVARIYSATWLLAALAFDVANAHEARYGGTLYPLLLVAGVLVLYGPRPLFRGRALAFLRPAATAATAAAFLLHGVGWTAEKLAYYRDNPTKSLHHALTAMRDAPSRVYVASAPGFFASPESLRIAWNLPFEPVFLYQFEGCGRASGGSAVLRGNEFAATLPGCAEIALHTADARLLLPGLRGSVHREGVGNYRFPEGRVVMPSIRRPEVPIVDFGRGIVVDFDPAQAPFELLAYDWSTGTYRRVTPSR